MTMVPLHTLAAGAYFVAMDLEVAGVVDHVGPGWVDVVIQRAGSRVREKTSWSRTTEVEECSRKYAVRFLVTATNELRQAKLLPPTRPSSIPSRASWNV